MQIVTTATVLRHTRESARRYRFEDVPFAPQIVTTPANVTAVSNAAIGTTIATLSVPGGVGTYAFALVTNPGARYAISGNQLQVFAPLVAGTDAIIVQGDNGAGSVVIQTVTVTISQSWATFDGAVVNGALSNGNLTFTGTGGGSGLARSTSQKSSGKYYFEVTAVTALGNNSCVAVITPAATANGVVGSGLLGGICFLASGIIYSNDVSTGLNLGSSIANGDVIAAAIDLDNHKVWFRKSPSGNWNGQAIGSQNPASNVGGVSVSNYNATTMAPAVGIDNTLAVWTGNFGQSAFNGSVPSGFTAGWPA